MADNWGKLILGVLAGAAIWKGIGPNGQQQVTDTLNTCAAEFLRIKQEEERQKGLALLLQAMENLPMEPRPVLPPIDLPVLPIPAAHPKMAVPVETDAHWREVLVAPAVVLILEKKQRQVSPGLPFAGAVSLPIGAVCGWCPSPGQTPFARLDWYCPDSGRFALRLHSDDRRSLFGIPRSGQHGQSQQGHVPGTEPL